MADSIRSLMMEGPVGQLEALLNVGDEDAKYAALVCHPHPLYGGTMHNKVVYHTMKALYEFGFPVLRFNFRGVGRSGGYHDGRAEVDDVRTAIDWLWNEFQLPIIFAGFSFGAATGLSACCHDHRVDGLIGLGTPVAAEGRIYAYGFLQDCAKPKLFISGTKDQFGPKTELEHLIAAAHPPTKLVWVEGADHFFEGKLSQMKAAIEEWVSTSFVGTKRARL